MAIIVFKYNEKEYEVPSKIESIILYAKMYQEYYKNIPEYMKRKQVIFDNDSQKEDIINGLKNCERFEIEEEVIILTYILSTEEIKEIKQDYFIDYTKFLKALYSYYKSIKYKETIKAYLLRFNLKYLIKELNKIEKTLDIYF